MRDYQSMRVDRLKDLDYAALSIEAALELADEDGCTDGFRYTVADLVEALGQEEARRLVMAASAGRSAHRLLMMSFLPQ